MDLIYIDGEALQKKIALEVVLFAYIIFSAVRPQSDFLFLTKNIL